MLYKIAHILRGRLSWLWKIIEWINGVIFYIRYGKRLKALTLSSIPNGYDIVPIKSIPTSDLVTFFEHQPEDAFTYFRPHGFDAKSIKLLQRNKAFLGYVLQDKSNEKIAGYCFNRCFFHGHGFRGRMVDIDYRGKGLGTAMNKILNEVGFGIGLRLFETVSKDNVASYRSAMSASNVKVVKEMPDNELYLEIFPYRTRMKTNTYELFYEIVRVGLWEREARLSSLEGVDWKEVYQLASEQSMLGLVLAGLENCNAKPPQELLLEWIGEVQMLEQQNKAMNGFVGELFEKLSKAGIKALLVKGQGVAQSYERPLWRCCGDIDLLMDTENYERAKDLLIPLADHVESEDKRKKHLGLYIGESLIELHGAMSFELSKKVDAVLDEVIDKANTDNTNGSDDLEGVSIPKANEHVVLIFTHFLHHFFIEGVGLRQICDWCRIFWRYRSELDLRLLESRIKRMGLMSEWKSFASLAVDYLGMPEKAMPFYDSRFKKRGSRIMDLVMLTGSFGHNKDLSYRTKYSGLTYKIVALGRRFVDFCRFVWVFPLDSPRFFVSYVMRKVQR